jgi:type 1 glutamine amidotransferase
MLTFVHPAMKPLLLVCGLLLALIGGGNLRAAEPVKIKALVVTGGHGFEKEPFFKMFADNPEIEFTAAAHSKTNASAYERKDLLSYDVVVLYDMPQNITETQKARFMALFDKGVGLVVLHHALVSYQNWPEYEQIIGGRYQEPDPNKPGKVTEAVGWQHDVDIPVVVVATNHTITTGVSDFMIHDEIYWGYRVGKDVKPILTTTHPKSGKPLAWTRTQGKSCVMFMQLGHGKSAFENENYRKLLAQGIRWAANRNNFPPKSRTAMISVNVGPGGPMISPDFSGFSFEVALLLPNENGVRYFRPDNQPLINLFRQLGIKSLRIGGNTSDRDTKKLPGEADWDSLFAFAKAANVKVIYTLRLLNGDPADAARTVKYLMDRYAPQVECFSIGQEPSAYPTQKVDTRSNLERMGATAEKYRYEDFRMGWKQFADIIMTAVPEVKFCGPAVHNHAEWARRFMADFAQSNHVTMCVMHLYAGGAGNKVPTPEIGRARMLSGEFLEKYQKLHDGFVPMAQTNGLRYRLEEVNNYFNGGATNVSDTFASALWGLEFMHWWAAHGAAGLNFHSGDRVAAGASLLPSKYTAYHSISNGYQVRPLGYAMKAFDVGGRGRVVSVETATTSGESLARYGVLAEDGTIYVTLINKDHGAAAKDVIVALLVADRYASGQTMLLTVPGGDVSAKAGVTLGNAEIKPDGSWNGQWSSARALTEQNVYPVAVPAASAVIVKLNRK